MQPETGGDSGSRHERESEIASLKAVSKFISSAVECRASISGLNLTFCDGKTVLRMVTGRLCDLPASPTEMAMENKPGLSFTEIGISPKLRPLDCKNNLVERSFSFAVVNSA